MGRITDSQELKGAVSTASFDMCPADFGAFQASKRKTDRPSSSPNVATCPERPGIPGKMGDSCAFSEGRKNHPHISSVSPSRNIASHTLSARQCDALVKAWDFAAFRGCPMNRTVTISISMLDPAESLEAFRDGFLNYLQALLRREVGFPAYLWVMERGPVHGLHIHMAMHTNQPSRLPDKLKRWLRMRCGYRGSLPKGAFNSRIIRDIGWLEYLLKGADAHTRDKLLRTYGLNVDGKSQGYIKGKRCGASRALGAKKQAASGYSQ
tara:strand:+ start:2994 stop:3791 length:798 start_codon:yes stop_codon:yes gene_type:complete